MNFNQAQGGIQNAGTGNYGVAMMQPGANPSNSYQFPQGAIGGGAGLSQYMMMQ